MKSDNKYLKKLWLQTLFTHQTFNNHQRIAISRNSKNLFDNKWQYRIKSSSSSSSSLHMRIQNLAQSQTRIQNR